MRQFNWIQSKWGPLGTYPFASHLNAQLPNYIAWKEHHHRMNAFHHHWQEKEYAFPPFAVICRVLCQVRRGKCWIVRDSANSTMLGDPDVVFDSQEDAMGQAHATLVQPKVTPGPSGWSSSLGKILRLMAWPIWLWGTDSSQRVGQRKILEQ